jgi:hypothetical protein
MKIFKALASGFCRTLKAWKGIVLIWFGSLLTVSLIVIPMKAFLKSGFGGSMITERLKDGIDIEVLGDLGAGFRNLMSSLPFGLLFLILISIVLYAFLAGGIFDVQKGSSLKFSGSYFFRACAKNFWPFLVISIIVSTIIMVLFLLIFVLPVSFVAQSGSESEKAPFMTAIISGTIFMALSLIFVLVADYARAWQAANDKPDCFKAIGFGFTRTFGTFLSSFPVILIITAVQICFTWAVFSFVGRWTPDTGGGVFLLFLITQLLVYIKSGLKVWSYGSVTALKEIRDRKLRGAIIVNTENFQG